MSDRESAALVARPPYRPQDGEWFCTGCHRPRSLMPGEEPCCGLGSVRVTQGESRG